MSSGDTSSDEYYLGVTGMLSAIDSAGIRGMAQSLCRPQGGRMRYAEVGSFLGLSATIVAAACPHALVFAHDLFPATAAELPAGSDPPPGADDLLVRFWANVARNGFEGRVVPMRGPSAETLRVHAPGSLDMAFCDGDHSFAGALADLRQLWHALRPGGALLAHDAIILMNGTDYSVRAAVNAFSSEINTTFMVTKYPPAETYVAGRF
jgi:predicted O-methyltransferase YrrM